MSNPISRSSPTALPAATIPTTPPAGPDRIASLPRNAAASVSPPFDCMNCSGTVGPNASATRATYFRRIGDR